jgi:3-ketosteroid 9alpha-monooxygenase subunit B
MRPAGLFTLRNRDHKVVLFGGGSGITPCISLIKTALATTRRRVELVYANRDEGSVIFRDELAELERRYPERFRVLHRYDVVHGFLDADAVRRQVGADLDADFYVCGPAPFMDVVESTLLGLGVSREHIFIERFGSPAQTAAPVRAAEAGEAPATITITLNGETRDVPYTPGDTVLVTARNAGLEPPFACEEGYCGCCMAQVKEGGVDMKANDCLDRSQLEEGWVLTCQGVPRSGKLRVQYPD